MGEPDGELVDGAFGLFSEILRVLFSQYGAMGAVIALGAFFLLVVLAACLFFAWHGGKWFGANIAARWATYLDRKELREERQTVASERTSETVARQTEILEKMDEDCKERHNLTHKALADQGKELGEIKLLLRAKKAEGD